MKDMRKETVRRMLRRNLIKINSERAFEVLEIHIAVYLLFLINYLSVDKFTNFIQYSKGNT